MEVKLASGNRVTIPKAVLEQTGYTSGDTFELSINSDGSLVLYPKIKTAECKLNRVISEVKPKPISVKLAKVKGIKIESNLAEGEHFSVKHYSICGLVIRTKNKYLDKFCEACKGELLKQYPDVHTCKYLTPSEKDVIHEIHENISRLNNKLDKTIIKLNESESNRNNDTVILPVRSKEYQRCCGCEEFFKTGFQIDDCFYCKKCAAKDFSLYLMKSSK